MVETAQHEPPFPDPTLLTRPELERQVHALYAVIRISRAVHLARDLNDLFDRAVDAIVRYTNFPSVALFRLDRTQSLLHLVASRGFGQASLDAAKQLPVDGSASGKAVLEQRVISIGELPKDARVEPSVRKALEHDGFVAAACIPLLGASGPLGVLNLIYQRPEELAESEHPTLLAIGHSIGLAMSQHLAADERKMLEERAVRAQQLESLGVLAGGIAHDFNNILTGVLGNVSLAGARLAAQEPASVPDLLCEVESACKRAAELARQLLTFARGGAPIKRDVHDLTKLVEEAARFAVRGSSIQLHFEASGDIGSVHVDPGQIMQVVQNLVLNALQASAAGGSIRVSLARREESVVLEVEDHGIGISEQDRPRIFEPYFSRRSGGTGLGLAMTHSIVLRHGGTISFESQLGVGSRFTVQLPVPSKPTVEPQVRSSPPPRTIAGLRVLVLDDEPSLRTLLSRMLESLGGSAVVVSSAEQAIAAFTRARKRGKPFDLLLLDLTLVGGSGGKQTLERLVAEYGPVRAVAMSGYSGDPVLADPAQHGFAQGLSKPFTLEELASALARALGQARSQPPQLLAPRS